MVGIQPNEFEQVIEAEVRRAGGSKRWHKALRRAARMIEADALMHWTGATLLIWSESGKVYEASSDGCQCRAFAEGFPCKHRAAYKLIKRLNEIAR